MFGLIIIAEEQSMRVQNVATMAALVAALALAGAMTSRPTAADEESNANASGPYMQGLGEFMLAGQLHHNKLWFAGDAGNWDLAGYEIDELKENLSNGAKYYPKSDDFDVAAGMKANIDAPLDKLDKAIEAKDKAAFVSAYTALTNACTACHSTAKKAFIRIVKPTAAMLTNQNYAPAK